MFGRKEKERARTPIEQQGDDLESWFRYLSKLKIIAGEILSVQWTLFQDYPVYLVDKKSMFSWF